MEMRDSLNPGICLITCFVVNSDFFDYLCITKCHILFYRVGVNFYEE